MSIWEARLPEIRGGPAEHLVLLPQQTDPLLELPVLGRLGCGDAGTVAVFDRNAAQPLRRRHRMDPEVGGDLLEGHPRRTVPGHSHDVAELLRIGLGYVDILPGHPHGQASSDVTSTRRTTVGPPPRRTSSPPAASRARSSASFGPASNRAANIHPCSVPLCDRTGRRTRCPRRSRIRPVSSRSCGRRPSTWRTSGGGARSAADCGLSWFSAGRAGPDRCPRPRHRAAKDGPTASTPPQYARGEERHTMGNGP